MPSNHEISNNTLEPQDNQWLELAQNNHETFANNTPEQLCRTEISPKQILGLVDFLDKNGCKDEYQAYEKFISDVPEEDKTKSIEVSFLDSINTDKLKHFGDSSFEHVRLFNGSEKTDDEISPSISGRLYICPSTANMPNLVEKLIESHASRGTDLVLKIAKNMRRNDRIVIYLTGNFHEEINLIKETQNDSPNLFTNCRKNKLWCDISGVEDVYYGEEPQNKAFSYGEDRARIIGEIFALQKEKLITLDDENQLKRIYQLECLKRRVNPFNWGTYIDNDEVGSAADDVLEGFLYPEFQQEPEYLDSCKKVDDWIASNASNAKNDSWLGDNIPEYRGN